MIHLKHYQYSQEHTITGDFNVVSKLAGLSLNLYTIVEKFLKVCSVEDAIRSRLGVVDNELVLNSRCFGSSGLGLEVENNTV